RSGSKAKKEYYDDDAESNASLSHNSVGTISSSMTRLQLCMEQLKKLNEDSKTPVSPVPQPLQESVSPVPQPLQESGSGSVQSQQPPPLPPIDDPKKTQTRVVSPPLTLIVSEPLDIHQSSDSSNSPRQLIYDKIKQLGQGATGTVYLANYEGIKVAVKEIYLSPSDALYEYRVGKIKRELEAHRTLVHPNLVNYHDSEMNRHVITIITDYHKYGSLDRYKPFNESNARSIILQVIKPLAYIHSQNIIHRDIKAANILVSDDRKKI
ncbi:unnamed protein product, partial [marine sediment metagenome]